MSERPEATPDALSLYASALEKWGGPAQGDMLVEEIGELLTAVQHFRRGRIGVDGVVEEIADVRIMLAQLELVLEVQGQQYVNLVIDRKLKRLHRRLNRVDLNTCADCGDTVPAGWQCSCDDGRD